MKYPAIYQSTVNGNVALLFNDKQGVTLDKFKATVGTSGEWDEDKFKNITAEYLANTYGEVKSKEHAEFIVELANNHGAICPTDINYNNCKFFYFSSTGALFFTKEKVVKLATDYKQITIPLPPECEGVNEWPKVGDDVFYKGQKWTFVAKHNDMAMLFWTGDEYCTAKISELQKPKTPEQGLRDELTRVMQRNLTYEQMVNDLIENFNITKKPQ